MRASAQPAGPAEALPPLSSDGLGQRASDLLYEVVLLRGLERAPDLDELRAQLVTKVRTFHRQALDDGASLDTVERAQYAICTLLDEILSGSEWGRGGWSRHSLLMIFHGQTSGGDGFFAYLDAAELKPRENLALLEVMYLCLALGLEGRYRIQSEGRAALALRRNQLRNDPAATRRPAQGPPGRAFAYLESRLLQPSSPLCLVGLRRFVVGAGCGPDLAPGKSRLSDPVTPAGTGAGPVDHPDPVPGRDAVGGFACGGV